MCYCYKCLRFALLLHDTEQVKTLPFGLDGQWRDSLRWFFNSDFLLPMSTIGSLRFFNGILQTWESICQALVFLPPKTYHQSMRQPLLWNPLFTDEVACVLGLQPRLY